MIRPLFLAPAFLVAGLMVAPAPAQDAPAPRPATPRNTDDSLFPPIPTDPADPAYHAGAHRTILRHNPLPTRRTSYSSSRSGSGTGFSNPGGAGRYAEYYDSNTLAPNIDNHPIPVAKFDSGGGPSRSEQMSAQELGIQRSRNLQNHIDTYGRPIGFGYGLGFAGGLGYAYPY